MKVLITTAGIGSRLGEMTSLMNKAMVKVGKKPVISYVIESYPEDTEFVVATGYKGEHIKQFLNLMYGDRHIDIVEVDNFCGPLSSPVYSQLMAASLLQEPFIYHSCDTIVEDLQSKLSDVIANGELRCNFLMGYKTNSGLYDSFNYDERSSKKVISKLFSKGESDSSMLSYIGIAGIRDYKAYWEAMEDAYTDSLNNGSAPSDFYVYKNILKDRGYKLEGVETDSWHDLGSISGVSNARKTFKDSFNVLDKTDQAVFIFDGKQQVVKFFAKDGVVSKLMERASTFNGCIPEIIKHTENFFIYKFVDGKDAPDVMTAPKFKKMISALVEDGLWKYDLAETTEMAKKDFHERQERFYIEKTMQRISKFKRNYSIEEGKALTINDIEIPAEATVEKMISLLPKCKEWQDAIYRPWHGDFILDNMLIKEDCSPVLLDWRESFNGVTRFGDMLYDFAKMNHNLTVSHKVVFNDGYKVSEDDNGNIRTSILVSTDLIECKKILLNTVEEKYGIRRDFIEALTGVVWLNMSPLHGYPFDKFLFYHGKLTLYKAVKALGLM